QQVRCLCLLAPAEERQIIENWSRTEPITHDFHCAHEIFEQWVHHTPYRIAVVSGNCQVSDCELDSRANQLAPRPHGLGIGIDRRVAISLGRSENLVLSVLGLLKSGAAYVPVDPELPAERIGLILEDIQAPVSVTVERLSYLLPASSSQVVSVDKDCA